MYVYRFLNKDGEIIYIGRSKDLKNRLNSHTHLSEECYNEIDRIEYIRCLNDDESSVYERYYINIINPKYNSQYKNSSEFSFELPEKEWKLYNKKIFNNETINITRDDFEITDGDLGKLIRIFQKCIIKTNLLYSKLNTKSSPADKNDLSLILNIDIKATERFIKRMIDKGIFFKNNKFIFVSDKYLVTEQNLIIN